MEKEKVVIDKDIYDFFIKIHKHLKSENVDAKFLKRLRALIKNKCNKTEIRKYYPILSVYEKEHLEKDNENIYLKGYIITLKQDLIKR